MQQSFKGRHRMPADYVQRFQRKDNQQGNADYAQFRCRDYERFHKRGSYVELRRHRGRKDNKRSRWMQKKHANEVEAVRNNEAMKEEETPKYSPSDTEKAFELERKYQKSNIFVLKFPDPFLDKSIIKRFSSAIQDVRVQQPITPRFVYVQLNPDQPADKVMEEINRTPFGSGFLRLEKLEPNSNTTTASDIDPLTIFIGGIPQFTPVQIVKQWLPHSSRLDVGYAKRHKFGRYAFAHYKHVDDSFKDFKSLKERENESDLIIRFRRIRGNVAMPNGKNHPSTSIKPTADVKVSNGQGSSGTSNGVVVIDLSDDDEGSVTVPTSVAVVKKEPEDHGTGQLMDIDWEKLRQEEIRRYETKPDLSKLLSISFNSLPEPATVGADIPNDFEDLLSQLDCDLNYIFNEDFEL